MILSTPIEWAGFQAGPFQFRAVPGAGQYAQIIPIGVASPTLFTPTQPIIIRSPYAWSDDADPLVAGGGATTVSLCIGDKDVGVNLANFIGASTIATWNSATNAIGAGVTNPTVPNQQEFVLYPAAARAGKAASDRSIRAICDAGTVTGTLYLAFQWKPMSYGSLLPAGTVV